ncbi:MAG: ABC transporter substrate-binding protein [Symbiobacteriia bacterium]
MRKTRLVAVLLAGAMLGSLALTGCGTSKPGTSGGTAEKKAEKVLIYARGADSSSLDPAFVDDGESAKVMNNIFDNLVKYNKGATTVGPSLATSWDTSADGKEWTFHLRQGVKFHDGSNFTADDVVFSVQRQMPGNKYYSEDMPYASFTFDPNIIDKVEKVDDYTVKFTLKTPYAPFLRNLAMGLAAPIISKAAYEKDPKGFGEHPIGTGPFKFVKWDKEQAITLEAFDQYWGGRAIVDKVVFKVTKVNSSRADELVKGDIDMMDGVDPVDVPRLKADSNIQLLSAPGMNINYIAFRTDKGPLANAKVRQALTMAFNKDEAVKALYGDFATSANGPLPPGLTGYDPTLKPYSYDLDGAKKLLQAAGYSESKKLTFDLYAYTNPRPYNPKADKLAVAFQADVEKTGMVKVNIVTNDWKGHKDAIQKQGKGDAYLLGWIGDNGDPDNFLTVHFDSKSFNSGNYMHYKNPQVDALLEKAAATLNEKERGPMYSEAQRLIETDAPWIFVSWAQDFVAMRKPMSGFYQHPTGSIWLKDVWKPTSK